MQIDWINPLNDAEWDELAGTHPECTVFHTGAWARTLHEAYGFQPRYGAARADGRTQCLLPLLEVRSALTGVRGVALPFTDYAPPLWFPPADQPGVLAALLEAARKARWKYLELRDGEPLVQRMTPSETFVNHYLTLEQSEQELFAGLHKNHRRNIRKAQKEGVCVRREHSPQALREFYELNCLTRRDHGLPPQPLRFFERLHENLIARQQGFVMLADYQGRCVAGCLYLHCGGRAVYKYGASDKLYTNTGANPLVMWEALRWFRQQGFQHFCFGRTELANEGLLRYKSGWGARERPIHYYRYQPARDCFVICESKLSGAHNRLFNRLPLPLLKLAGRLLYRHVA